MKTLDEIINREDYTRLNNALRDRAIELACKLHDAVRPIYSFLDDEFRLGGQIFELREMKANSGYSDEFLYMCDSEDGDLRWYCIERHNSFYYCGDFNCYIKAAPSRVLLNFLNSAKQIFTELDEFKNSLCTSISKSLEETKEL